MLSQATGLVNTEACDVIVGLMEMTNDENGLAVTGFAGGRRFYGPVARVGSTCMD